MRKRVGMARRFDLARLRAIDAPTSVAICDVRFSVARKRALVRFANADSTLTRGA